MFRIVLFLLTNAAVLVAVTLLLELLQRVGVLPPLASAQLNAWLGLAAVFGIGGSLVSLLASKAIAKWTTGARTIEHPQTAAERWLVQSVRELADQAGIGTPEVAIFESEAPNAFATGWNRNESLVAVSRGLLRSMDAREVRAVLAHEVAHVANGDMVTLALLQGVLNTFVILIARLVGSFVDRVFTRDERSVGPAFFVVSLVAELVLGLLASIIVMAFSRWREFRADRGAAELVGRGSMIAALQRLRYSRPDPLPESMRAFGIHGPGTLARLLSSHPPLEARIAALQGDRARRPTRAA